VSFNRAGCTNEEEAVDLINNSFLELIEEQTFPWLIQRFVDFDKNVMMPIFKRKANLKTKRRRRLAEVEEEEAEFEEAIN